MEPIFASAPSATGSPTTPASRTSAIGRRTFICAITSPGSLATGSSCATTTRRRPFPNCAVRSPPAFISGAPTIPHSPAESARVTKEAEFALKQAFAYCPYSPEAVFHFMNLLLNANRIDDALVVLKTCHKLDPYNDQINDWIDQLERNKTTADGGDQISQFFDTDSTRHRRQTKRPRRADAGPASGIIPRLTRQSLMRVADMYLRHR